MNSLCSLGLPSCWFSRSLLSCHRSYVNSTPKCHELFRGPRRRSLSKIINLLHLSPKIGRFSGAPNTHLVLISLIVERLFHRKLPTVSQTNPRQPRFQRLLESIQIIYRPSHIIIFPSSSPLFFFTPCFFTYCLSLACIFFL